MPQIDPAVFLDRFRGGHLRQVAVGGLLVRLGVELIQRRLADIPAPGIHDPLGGLGFIAAWIALAWALARH